MVTQITPTGTTAALSTAGSPQSVAVRSAAPRAAVQAQGSSGQAAAVAQVNLHLQQSQTELKLQMDPGSGRPVFQIVQQGTGEVVLQVPSEEVLGMSARVRDMEGQSGASGALVDKKG